MSNTQLRAPVIVAGAGPTGLTLATELRRGGIDVLLLEQRSHRGQNGSRAAGMQPRTIEMLDQRGVVDRFLAAGPPAHLGNFAGIVLDYSTLPSRFPYALNILQADTEQILWDIATELGVAMQWSTTVTGFRQDATGVDVIVDTPRGSATLRGSYLVACDGGRSTIRKLAGIGFPGTDATMACLIGDVELDDPPERPLFLHRRTGWSLANHTAPPALMIQSVSRSCGHRYGGWLERISVCTARGGCRISTMPFDRPSAIGSGGCYWPAMPHISTFRPAGRA
jgi:2-polyprenyl-6-methoxyphenol hydroxylase-like FAD-dependent oxidoreductase